MVPTGPDQAMPWQVVEDAEGKVRMMRLNHQMGAKMTTRWPAPSVPGALRAPSRVWLTGWLDNNAGRP